MHSASGVDLVSAKLQSTLLQAQKKFISSNPGSRSKNLLRKERKRQNKLKRQFPFYNNLSDQSPTDSKGFERYFQEDNLFGNTTSWNPAQIQIDFEEVDESNIFIDQVKAKYECLNPSYNLKEESEETDRHKQGGTTDRLLGSVPSYESKNEDVDSGVDSLGGSSSSSNSIPSSARHQSGLVPKLDKTKAEKKKKKNLEKNKNKLQNLLARRLNSINSEETEKLLPKHNNQNCIQDKPSEKKLRKMKDISADVDTIPATTNQIRSPQSLTCSTSKTSTSPTLSSNNSNTNGNGNGNNIPQSSPAKNISPTRPVQNQNNIISSNGKIPQLPQPRHMLYPREKIQAGWRQKMPVGCGFTNMGNSCYMNATLQALFHVPSFVNWLLGDEAHRNKCKGYLGNQFTNHQCIVCAMYNTLRDSFNQHLSQSIRPSYIHNRLKVICKHFTHGRQEDAHEFLRYLLESMERSYLTTLGALKVDVRSKETTPIGQIFGGYIRTEVTCERCNTVSTTFQPLAELQLDIRHVTSLEDAITNHFKRERLDNNDYKCEKCRTFSAATKQFSLEVPPIALCLQLKRFTLYGMKISKPIHCNKFLNLTRFLHKSLLQGNHKDVKYRLTSLITHIGSSPNCGHYTAIAQAANGSLYQFDDSYVRTVPLQQAINSDAYVIIYELDTGNYEKPSSCFNATYTNNNNNSPLSSLKSNNVNNSSNLSKLLTGNSELNNGVAASPSPNGNANNGSRPKFQNPFLKSAEKLTNSNPFSKVSQPNGSATGTGYTKATNGLANLSSPLEKREKISFTVNSQNHAGTKPNPSSNKIMLKNPEAHFPKAASYLTTSARARQSLLPEKTLASLNALVKPNGKPVNGETCNNNNVEEKLEKKEDNRPSLLKAELLSPVKKAVIEVTPNSKTLPKECRSSASLVPYDGDDDEDSTSEEEKEKEDLSSRPKTPPAQLAETETNQDRHVAQSPPPAPTSAPIKYHSIFNKSPAVKSWDNQKSVISQVEETSRKREKTREELEDEEFDAGHTKKRKTDEFSKSRSSPASTSNDGRDQYGSPSNKFQAYEDKRHLVEKRLIPSISNSRSPLSSGLLGNQNRPSTFLSDNLAAKFSSNNSNGFSNGDGRSHVERNDRPSNNERRENSSGNNFGGFNKYSSPNSYRGRHQYNRGGGIRFNNNRHNYSNNYRRGGGGAYNTYNKSRYNNNYYSK